MKNLILILLFSSTIYADDIVKVNSLTDVIVNGEPANFFVDAVRNFPSVKSQAFHTGLEGYLKTLTDISITRDKALEAAEALKAVVDKEAPTKSEKDAAKAKLDEAKQPEKDRRKTEIDKQIADLQTERASLDTQAIEAVKASLKVPVKKKSK